MPVSDDKSPAGQNDVIKQLQHEENVLTARIMLKLLADPGRKRKLLDLIRQVLAGESGGGPVKRLYSGMTMKILPGLMDSLTAAISPENPAPDIARLLTTVMRIRNYQEEKKSPADRKASAGRFAETVDAFLADLDLGELNQILELSQDQTILLAESLSAMLQDNHLGKLAALAPAMVSAGNLLTATLNRFLRQIHDTPPDFLAGFLAGLIELLDAEALAEFLNHKNELIRMLHIGNLLQGDGKITALERAITDKSRQALRNIDPDLFCKKETGTAELAETVHKSLRQAMTDYPEFLQKIIINRVLSVNTRIRSLQGTLSLLLSLPEEILAQSLADAFDSLNTDEFSEIFGSSLTLLQSVHEQQPGMLGKLLTNIVKTIDDDDLTAAAGIFVQEAVEAVKPLAGAVMPPLLNGLAELIAASLEDSPETTAAPLSRLLAMMKTGGETT